MNRREMRAERKDWTCERRKDEPVTPDLLHEILAIFAFAIGLAAIIPAACALRLFADWINL